MYSYTLSMEADTKVFKNTCALIEKMKNVQKNGSLLEDVDGSLIQKYTVSGKKIKVFSDCLVDAVYVDSDMDLDHVFPKETKVDM